MRIGKYISVKSVIAKLYRDLGIEEISETDCIEWASEALEHMNVHGMYDINTCFLEVRNYQCEMPVGFHSVLQIAKHNRIDKIPPKPSCIFFECEDNPCGCDNEQEQHTDCCNCPEPKETKLCVCQSYVNNWGFYLPMRAINRQKEKMEWTLVLPTDNNFFNLGMCEGKSDVKFNEYRVDNGKILFSFKSGMIAMSYEGVRVDEDGYPLVPDDVSAMEAIRAYITYKFMSRQWYLGREGYQDKMMKSEQDWHWYCKQFKNKVLMPNEDEYRKLSLKERTQIPRYTKDWWGYISIDGTMCSNILIKEECCNEPIIPHHPYKSIKRLDDYLYKIIYDSIPEYKNGFSSEHIAGCSSYVQDGKLYRNLDWFYAETVEFWVKTPYFEGISYINGFNRNDNVTDNIAKRIPYNVVDGVNEHGIMMSTHVLYNDFNWTGSGNENIDLTLLPYLVMMNVKSMNTISEDLSDIISNLKATPQLISIEYLLQILVTDGSNTSVITPTSNGYVIEDITSIPKLANFKWINKNDLLISDQDLQLRPNGIERWNMMPIEMNELRFTLAYESNERLSEFIGIDGTTKESLYSDLNDIYIRAHNEYTHRLRDGKLWHTMHSVVYNPNRMEALFIQEDFNNNFINH